MPTVILACEESMGEEPGWRVDVESCSTERLAELLVLLQGSENRAQLLEVQQEIVRRARRAGRTTTELVNGLTRHETRKGRAVVAKEWSSALGITEEEFRRISG